MWMILPIEGFFTTKHDGVAPEIWMLLTVRISPAIWGYSRVNERQTFQQKKEKTLACRMQQVELHSSQA